MTRVLIAVVVGFLFTSVALARPKQVIVRAGHPVAVVASNGAERGWWLLLNEHGRWTRWDGPYYAEYPCIDDTGDWHRANPHKVFACVEAK